MATTLRAHPPREAPKLVSVVIPARNAGSTLEEQLAALSKQTYAGAWEVIIADNGSTDGTSELARRWEDRLPKLIVLDASERPGSSFARNCGARVASGDFLAFCDADDVVAPAWLDELARAAPEYDALTGLQDATEINVPEIQAWRSARSRGLPRAGFLPYAPSCNLGVWADVFARTGGFNEEYPQAHDVEWSWRAQLATFTLGCAPGAVVHYRYRTSARGVARQGYVVGLDLARLYRDYRRHGMPPRPLRVSLRTWAWIVVRSPYLMSAARRGIWLRRAGEAAGRLSGSLQLRVLYL